MSKVKGERERSEEDKESEGVMGEGSKEKVSRGSCLP